VTLPLSYSRSGELRTKRQCTQGDGARQDRVPGLQDREPDRRIPTLTLKPINPPTPRPVAALWLDREVRMRPVRRGTALWLLVAIWVQGCASGGGSRPADPATASGSSMEAANRLLEGQEATIELRGGEVVEDAESVAMTPEITSWRADGSERKVATTEVVRVTRQAQSRARKGFLWGLLGGAPVALAVASSYTPGRDNWSLSKPLVFGLIDVAGGLAGMLIALGSRLPRDRVVYAAGGAVASGSGRTSSVSGPAGADLGAGGDGNDAVHCRLARPDAAPGSPAIECRRGGMVEAAAAAGR
jgi:hypothetical protein